MSRIDGGPTMQGMQSTQKGVKGQFKDFSFTPGISHNEIQEQSDLKTSGSFTSGTSVDDRTASKTGPASRQPGNSDRLSRMGTLVKWVLNKFVQLRWMGEQSARNLLSHFLVAVRNEGTGLLQAPVGREEISDIDSGEIPQEDTTPSTELEQAPVSQEEILDIDSGEIPREDTTPSTELEQAPVSQEEISDIDSGEIPREDTTPSTELEQAPVSQGKISNLDLGKISQGGGIPSTELEPRQILENGIMEAFFNTTDGIDDDCWDDIRARLPEMHLGKVRGYWQTMANEVAVSCFDATGNVDVGKLRGWMEFLGNAETFQKEPYCFVPHAEFMRSQMHAVCESLVLNSNDARDLLNAAKSITVGLHGESILETMFQGMEPPLTPNVAILASLFTPHRQLSLPACTIHSTINAEIRNHPERLIEMYTQMLGGDQFTFPSGYAVQQQSIVNDFITVDLKDGGRGKEHAFEDITSGDPDRIAEQKGNWEREGIGYSKSTNEAEKYKLKLPIHNMNDVLFANFIQASNFGNKKIDHNHNFGTALVYAGHERERKIFSSTVLMAGGPGFLEGMTKLKGKAEAQRQLGHRYMRVGTSSSDGGHAENIDINALLNLDLNKMETGKAYAIGDRNWSGSWDMSQDIPRLAVRKMGDTPPTFKFGTLRGSTFEETDMRGISVYNTGVEVRDADYWEQFEP
jgi:hypothetical protein